MVPHHNLPLVVASQSMGCCGGKRPKVHCKATAKYLAPSPSLCLLEASPAPLEASQGPIPPCTHADAAPQEGLHQQASMQQPLPCIQPSIIAFACLPACLPASWLPHPFMAHGHPTQPHPCTKLSISPPPSPHKALHFPLPSLQLGKEEGGGRRERRGTGKEGGARDNKIKKKEGEK